MARATKREVELAHESYEWACSQWQKEVKQLRTERDEAVQQREYHRSLLLTAHEAWQQAEKLLTERNAEIERLDAEIDRLRAIIPVICPHCGGRNDVGPHSQDRCMCLPVIREKNEIISDLDAEIERLRGEVEEAHTKDAVKTREINLLVPEVKRQQARAAEFARHLAASPDCAHWEHMAHEELAAAAGQCDRGLWREVLDLLPSFDDLTWLQIARGSQAMLRALQMAQRGRLALTAAEIAAAFAGEVAA